MKHHINLFLLNCVRYIKIKKHIKIIKYNTFIKNLSNKIIFIILI